MAANTMRTIIGLATITLALALTGCQKQSTDEADEPDEPSKEATKDEPSKDDEPTASAASASDPTAAAKAPAGTPPVAATTTTGNAIPGVAPTAPAGTNTAALVAPPDKTAPPDTTATKPKEPQRCGSRFPPCPAGQKCSSERIGVCQ